MGGRSKGEDGGVGKERGDYKEEERAWRRRRGEAWGVMGRSRDLDKPVLWGKRVPLVTKIQKNS